MRAFSETQYLFSYDFDFIPGSLSNCSRAVFINWVIKTLCARRGLERPVSSPAALCPGPADGACPRGCPRAVLCEQSTGLHPRPCEPSVRASVPESERRVCSLLLQPFVLFLGTCWFMNTTPSFWTCCDINMHLPCLFHLKKYTCP